MSADGHADHTAEQIGLHLCHGFVQWDKKKDIEGNIFPPQIFTLFLSKMLKQRIVDWLAFSLLLMKSYFGVYRHIPLHKCPLLWVDVCDPDHKLTVAIYLTASFGENPAQCYYLSSFIMQN